MRLWSRIAAVLAFVPLMAAAQFNDLDTAVSNLTRGFGNGDPQAIVAGIGAADKVNVAFPGLIDQNGFFGRDQAAYLLDGLFSKVHPTGFEQQSARRVSAEGQYYITASWNIQVDGKPDTRELYITLKKQGEKWAVTSVRSGGK